MPANLKMRNGLRIWVEAVCGKCHDSSLESFLVEVARAWHPPTYHFMVTLISELRGKRGILRDVPFYQILVPVCRRNKNPYCVVGTWRWFFEGSQSLGTHTLAICLVTTVSAGLA